MDSGGQSYPPPNTRWWREVELPHEHRDGTGTSPHTAEWDPELERKDSRPLITIWKGNQDEEELLWEELVRDVDLQRAPTAEPNMRESESAFLRAMKYAKKGHPSGQNKAEDEQPVFKVGYLDSPDTSQIFKKESWELINEALEKIHANDMAAGMTKVPHYPSTPERSEYTMPDIPEHRFRSLPKRKSSPFRDFQECVQPSPQVTLPEILRSTACAKNSPIAHCSTQSPDEEKTRRYINRLEEAVRQNLAIKKKDQQASHLSPRHKDSAFELWKERAISFLKISEEARQKYEEIKRRRAGLPNDRHLISYILDTMKSLGLLAMDIVRNAFVFCYLLGCMMCRLSLEAYRAPRYAQILIAIGFILALVVTVYLTNRQYELMYSGYDFSM